MERRPWAEARRIVVKLGTHVVMGQNVSPAENRLRVLTQSCADAWRQGRELLLVSSGAVGLGRRRLGLEGTPLTVVEKQACAAVGQTLLMDLYRDLFDEQGINTAQVLLTASDFSDRNRYLMLRQTLEKLLSLRAIPIINENDTVSTMELERQSQTRSFGDNDKLSALLAGKLDADILIMLTNVDGIFSADPVKVPGASRIERIDSFEQLVRIETQGESAYGRGGMTTKLEAARIASISGVVTLICSGMTGNPLAAVLDETGDTAPPGTLVLARPGLRKRRRWIGFASGSSGTVVVNSGARLALVSRQASLLPIGVVAVEGDFQAGQVVSVQDEERREIGRGIVDLPSSEIRRVRGLQSTEAKNILGTSARKQVIHRDNLVIFEEHFTESRQENSSHGNPNPAAGNPGNS